LDVDKDLVKNEAVNGAWFIFRAVIWAIMWLMRHYITMIHC
jgi:hypothetical protein